jgi:hypothetical protein
VPIRRFAPLALAAITTVLASTVVVASAAGLGGISTASLWATSRPVTIDVPDPPDPVIPVCDSFGTPNGPLDGRPAGCGGGAWATSGRPWNVSGGQVQVNGGSGSLALVPAGSAQISVSVTVFDAHRANRVGGVVLSAGAGDHLAAVLMGTGTVELRLGSGAILATAPVALGPSTTLRATRIDDQVWVQVNGTLVLSGTFPQVDSLTGTSAGMFHGGGPRVGFADFAVSNPTPPPAP